MKKTVSLIIIAAIFICLLTSCHPSSYTMEESQMDSILSSKTETVKKVRPSAEQILGTYTIKGSKADEAQWKIYVKLHGEKITVQIVDPDQEPKELTDDILEMITSEYNPKTGRYYQSYVTEDHTSVYEAYFSVENGRVKIDINNTYFYHSDGNLRNGIKVMGYKDTENTGEGL